MKTRLFSNQTLTSIVRLSQIIQRRLDGSVDFYRTQNEYKEGFGDPRGEFWLGNKHIYTLTRARNNMIRVELKTFAGQMIFAEYSKFQLSNSYRIKIGEYSEDGTAGEYVVCASDYMMQ